MSITIKCILKYHVFRIKIVSIFQKWQPFIFIFAKNVNTLFANRKFCKTIFIQNLLNSLYLKTYEWLNHLITNEKYIFLSKELGFSLTPVQHLPQFTLRRNKYFKKSSYTSILNTHLYNIYTNIVVLYNSNNTCF